MYNLKFVGLCILSFVFEYCLGAFVQADLNFSLWTLDARMLVAFMFAGSAVLTGLIIIDGGEK